jgi:IS30 family transposase
MNNYYPMKQWMHKMINLRGKDVKLNKISHALNDVHITIGRETNRHLFFDVKFEDKNGVFEGFSEYFITRVD